MNVLAVILMVSGLVVGAALLIAILTDAKPKIRAFKPKPAPEWLPRPNGPMVHESQAAKITAGELGAADPVQVSMRRDEWCNLLRALRNDPAIQPQLGRYAWRAVAEIEFALSENR